MASVETTFKYEGYLRRQEQAVERQRSRAAADSRGLRLRRDSWALARRWSSGYRGPAGTLGQASRIPGVTPAAVAVARGISSGAGDCRRRHGLRGEFDSLLAWPAAISAPARARAARRAVRLTTARRRLAAYYDLLARWNREDRPDGAPTDPDEAIDRLLLEPLVAARLLPARQAPDGRRIRRRFARDSASSSRVRTCG